MSKNKKENLGGKVAVIRIRGSVHLRESIKRTLELLNLHKKNHCVLFDATAQTMGMVKKVKDYVTWGEVDAKTIETLLKQRARVSGGNPLTDEYVKSNSEYADIKALADALASNGVSIKSVTGLKPVFRLKPPTKGFERAGIKKPFSVGGALGYREDKIKDLVARMI